MSQSLVLKLNKFKDYDDALKKLRYLDDSYGFYQKTYEKAYELILKYFKVEKYG